MLLIILFVFSVAVPMVLQFLAKHYPWVDKVGVVTLCYIAGIIFGNLPGVQVPEKEGTTISGVVISLCIPLLLFSSDFKVWRKLGKRLLLSFACCVVAVTLAVIAGTYLFKDSVDEAWKIGSMLMGVYTGGTPNLTMIGTTLHVSDEAFPVVNGAEMLFGGIWLLFLLSAAKPFFSKFLHAHTGEENDIEFSLDERLYWKTSSLALVMGILILAVAFGLSQLVPSRLSDLVILLTITTAGLLFSLIPAIRKMRGSYGMGNFLLLIFCVIVGSMADVHRVLGAAPMILGFVATVMGLAIVIHALLCRLLHIDTDTFLIGSTAGIYGPPFIAPVARAIRNPQLVSVGIALGLLGLAIGNYLGYAISTLLVHF